MFEEKPFQFWCGKLFNYLFNCTVKLGFKEQLNKEQFGNSEPFPVTNMPVQLINNEQIGFSEQLQRPKSSLLPSLTVLPNFQVVMCCYVEWSTLTCVYYLMATEQYFDALFSLLYYRFVLSRRGEAGA